MNRPNKDYYTKYWVKENEQYVLRGLKRYQEDLEKYCDELEKAMDSEEETIDFQRNLLVVKEKETQELNRALDKACALLTYDQFNAIPPKELLNFCMKDWKAWLLKDE